MGGAEGDEAVCRMLTAAVRAATTLAAAHPVRQIGLDEQLHDRMNRIGRFPRKSVRVHH